MKLHDYNFILLDSCNWGVPLDWSVFLVLNLLTGILDCWSVYCVRCWRHHFKKLYYERERDYHKLQHSNVLLVRGWASGDWKDKTKISTPIFMVKTESRILIVIIFHWLLFLSYRIHTTYSNSTSAATHTLTLVYSILTFWTQLYSYSLETLLFHTNPPHTQW